MTIYRGVVGICVCCYNGELLHHLTEITIITVCKKKMTPLWLDLHVSHEHAPSLYHWTKHEQILPRCL